MEENFYPWQPFKESQGRILIGQLQSGGHSQPSPVVMGRAGSSHSDHLFRQREVLEKMGGEKRRCLQWKRLPVR